ncbi:hypothetical protein KP509_06G049400 [Ceratopteris richardii]|uniref:Uncharacterized protein n=1 Tax=Ceratopteris richardii TaxID=49495 RepID=A0A8T2UKM4_CERRI|nr:hypothetical protein KP509_06G049400 [Ceratopteris richardii]
MVSRLLAHPSLHAIAPSPWTQASPNSSVCCRAVAITSLNSSSRSVAPWHRDASTDSAQREDLQPPLLHQHLALLCAMSALLLRASSTHIEQFSALTAHPCRALPTLSLPRCSPVGPTPSADASDPDDSSRASDVLIAFGGTEKSIAPFHPCLAPPFAPQGWSPAQATHDSTSLMGASSCRQECPLLLSTDDTLAFACAYISAASLPRTSPMFGPSSRLTDVPSTPIMHPSAHQSSPAGPSLLSAFSEHAGVSRAPAVFLQLEDFSLSADANQPSETILILPPSYGHPSCYHTSLAYSSLHNGDQWMGDRQQTMIPLGQSASMPLPLSWLHKPPLLPLLDSPFAAPLTPAMAYYAYTCMVYFYESLCHPAPLVTTVQHRVPSSHVPEAKGPTNFICGSSHMPYLLFLYLDDAILWQGPLSGIPSFLRVLKVTDNFFPYSKPLCTKFPLTLEFSSAAFLSLRGVRWLLIQA